MKKLNLTIIAIAFFTTLVYSQKPTQTVRGTIIDADNQMPLIGATLMIPGSDPLIGTVTDLDGKFRLENIPVGRIILKLSYIGYETKTIPNIVVNSGKEVVLNLTMQESVLTMNEVVITANRNKGEATNTMSIISARSISPEETSRYAGGFSDPSRILSSFAGVSSSANGENDIIVRGNSPKYIQWRLEGVEITNPTHFADQNSIKGGISALNNNLLATSDFYTGAFSPEYGNVLSGVYDLKLRSGNNEKFEAAIGVGIIGTDITLEGPFKKGYAGSYLINYRYSTVSLISDLGLIDVDGALNYQDMTFKVLLPTKKMGAFSIFGLAGLSGFSLEGIAPDGQAVPDNNIVSTAITKDYDKNTNLLNTGMNHTLSVSKNSYIKTSLSYSNSGNIEDVFESSIVETTNVSGEIINDTVDRTLKYKSRLYNSAYRAAMVFNNKINAKNKIQIGAKYTIHQYDNKQNFLQDDLETVRSLTDFKENVGVVRNYISWKHSFNEKLTMVTGIQNMNVFLTKESTLEPRIALNWKLNNSNTLHAGYGKHSTMENIHNYFAKVEQDDGSVTEPNKDLGLLKAHHFILGYEKRFTENLMAKVEVYYQHLYDLPVENIDTSYYATINEGTDFRYVDLVNEGTGKNYGIEITLERFYANNYYYLINASLFGSKYKSLEGVERNTQYNSNYLVNVLFGKEFKNLGKKDNQTLALNSKMFFSGARKIVPLLRDGNGNLAVDPANDKYRDYEKAYEGGLENVFQINLSASYKWNNPKVTHELFLDLINLTNNTSNLFEYYDESESGSIGYVSQFGFFPNLMYRVYF